MQSNMHVQEIFFFRRWIQGGVNSPPPFFDGSVGGYIGVWGPVWGVPIYGPGWVGGWKSTNRFDPRMSFLDQVSISTTSPWLMWPAWTVSWNRHESMRDDGDMTVTWMDGYIQF